MRISDQMMKNLTEMISGSEGRNESGRRISLNKRERAKKVRESIKARV